MSKYCWKHDADRLAPCRVSKNLQFVKNVTEKKGNKTRYACTPSSCPSLHLRGLLCEPDRYVSSHLLFHPRVPSTLILAFAVTALTPNPSELLPPTPNPHPRLLTELFGKVPGCCSGFLIKHCFQFWTRTQHPPYPVPPAQTVHQS